MAKFEDDDRDEPRSSRRGDYEEHRGTLMLVLGILSLVVCQFIGPIAWLMASGDMKKIENGTMDPEGKSNTQIGKILGIVGTGLLVLQLLAVCAYVALIVFVVGAAGAGAAGAGPGGMR